MYKGKKILGLIPARGGSKGLPGKNIKPLCGKPLIAWAIEQGLASKYLDKVIVSTDDEEIAKVSRSFGAEVPFMRPGELATDAAKTIDVVVHALEFLKQRGGLEFDYLALLEPTSPLRKNGDIDKSIAKLIDNGKNVDCLVSLGKISLEHPEITKSLDINGYVKPFFEQEVTATRRQDYSSAYFPYGVIYLSKVETLFSSKTFYQERTLPFLIERWQNYEVDDIYDFMVIETILKQKMGEIR
jgi:CMP-N,N'-diacetyllegionaminic acid synthase